MSYFPIDLYGPHTVQRATALTVIDTATNVRYCSAVYNGATLSPE